MSAQVRSGIPLASVKVPAAKARKPRNNEESKMQQALLRWWHATHSQFGVPLECLFAIPNGMRKGAIIGSILKREGVRAGVPDLMLACPKRAKTNEDVADAIIFGPHAKCMCAGCFLELKTPSGVISTEQRQYHAILSAQGYKVVVVRSLEQGILEITSYLTK